MSISVLIDMDEKLSASHEIILADTQEGVDAVFGRTSERIQFAVKVETGKGRDLKAQLDPGSYLVRIRCADISKAIIEHNRVVKLSLLDCSKETVANTIVNLLSGIFVPEYQLLMAKYMNQESKNVRQLF